MKPIIRKARRVAAITALFSLAIGLPALPASAWYDNYLPTGCQFTANPQTPYLSGGRIYSKVTFKVSGCTGRTFERTHAISEASTPVNALPYYSKWVTGVVPDEASMTISMPCKRGNWATTLSLDFGNGRYGFAQSGVLSTTC